MKNKFIIALLCASAAASPLCAQEITQKKVLTAPNYFQLALDKNGKTFYITWEAIGDNTKITILDGIDIVKEFTMPIKSGKYGPVNSDGYQNFLKPSDVLNFFNEGTGRDVMATQNLFNNDDKWEVFFEDYNANDGTLTYLVYNEDGTLLGEYDRDLYGDYMIISSSGQPFIIKSEYYDELDDYLESIYSFYDNGSSGVRPAALTPVKQSNAYPNPVPEGHSLTIDFGSALEADGMLSIIDINGRTVYRRRVAQGSQNTKVPSHRFGRGRLIYVVAVDGAPVATGKVIAE